MTLADLWQAWNHNCAGILAASTALGAVAAGCYRRSRRWQAKREAHREAERQAQAAANLAQMNGRYLQTAHANIQFERIAGQNEYQNGKLREVEDQLKAIADRQMHAHETILDGLLDQSRRIGALERQHPATAVRSGGRGSS